MANLITDWRVALRAHLVAAFPSAEIEDGERSGTSRDKDRIGVFWPGSGELRERVVVGQATLIVRYWKRNPKIRDAGSPLSPAELEQAGWDLQTFFESKQTAYTAQGVWFCRLVSVTPDYDPEEWAVEAVITANFDNPAVLA